MSYRELEIYMLMFLFSECVALLVGSIIWAIVMNNL